VTDNAQRAVAQFAAELAELRRLSGQPSLRRMEVLSRRAKRPRLPHSTAGDALTGRRLPPISVVLGIVLACLDSAREDGVEVDLNLFNTIKWQDRWLEVSRLCDEQDEEPAHQPLLDHVAPPAPPGMMWLPDRRRSGYLIIGNVSSREAPPLPWVARNVDHMTASLETAAPWMKVTTVIDPTLEKATLALRSAAQQAEDVLIVHLLGHGYLDDRVNLRLLTSDSRIDDLSGTTLDLTSMIGNLAGNSNAQALVLIIDTCFAGSVLPKSGRNSKQHLFVLAATDAHGLAIDGPDSLTGVMASVLGRGAQDCPFPMLSVDHLARECARTLEQRQRDNHHLPHQVVTTFSQGDASKITFGLNTAVQ
jgi:hypothetical protein